jgi:hypothetical protein
MSDIPTPNINIPMNVIRGRFHVLRYSISVLILHIAMMTKNIIHTKSLNKAGS